MPNPNITFGKVIAALRQAAKLSQEEFAERAEIHRTYVSQIERGLKSPTVSMLFKLAAGLGTTPSKILRLVESEVS